MSYTSQEPRKWGCIYSWRFLTASFFVRIMYSSKYRLLFHIVSGEKTQTKACIVDPPELFANQHLFSVDLAAGAAGVYLGLCLSSFPRVETRFNTHYQNAYANAFLKLLRYHRSLSIASTSREEGLVTAQFDP